MSKNKRDIIMETANFYAGDPGRTRATVGCETAGSACVYLSADGRMCAVGRCMHPDASDRLLGRSVGVSMLDTYDAVRNVYHIDEHLREEYHGHGVTFWGELQDFHDDDANWNPDMGGGLSFAGVRALTGLLEKWG